MGAMFVIPTLDEVKHRQVGLGLRSEAPPAIEQLALERGEEAIASAPGIQDDG